MDGYIRSAMAQDFAKDSRAKKLTEPGKKKTPADGGSGAHELAAAVDDLLDQLQHKFDKVSTEIFGKCE